MNANKRYRIPVTSSLIFPEDKVNINTYLDDIADAVDTSTGTPSASKIVVTGDDGKINNSLIHWVITSTGSSCSSLLVMTDNTGKIDESLLPTNYGRFKVTGSGYFTTPAGGLGLHIKTGSSGSYGAYLEITSGYASAVSILGYDFWASNIGIDGEVRIARGTAGSESVISTFPMSGDPNQHEGAEFIPIPIDVSSGVRLAISVLHNGAQTTTANVTLILALQSDIVPV